MITFHHRYQRNQPFIVILINNEELKLEDLKDYSFVYQKEYDKGQEAAIQYVLDVNRWNGITTDEKQTVYQALKDYVETPDHKALVMNKSYIETLANNEYTSEFVKDLKLVWEYDDVNAYDFSLVNNPFQIYIVGSDDRGSAINENSRYDVDMILTVNPNTKQVLLLSIPRDAYVKNYAYDEVLDKLDLTGKSGLDNARRTVNDKFKQNISLYILTNFVEFQKMIDVMGGLDIYNPYTFKLDNGIGGGVPYYGNVRVFYEGDYHVSGAEALAYARERYTLYDWAGSPVGKYNGDMARNMHHLILMKGIIKKLISLETLVNYEALMEQIKDCFHTNISFSQMYALAIMQFVEKPEWNIVYQHIYAEYVSDYCASDPDSGLLTVGLLDENDVNYVIDLMNRVMAGEIIIQEPIPSELY